VIANLLLAVAACLMVLAAGEIFFALHAAGDDDAIVVAEISNQSTGYCPDPTSWPAVDAALTQIGFHHPPHFTTECVFRKCNHCSARNIVKDDWFHCALCDRPLSPTWNFP